MENRKLISQAVRYALAAGVAASVTGIPLAASAAPAPLPQPATASNAQTLGTIEVTGSRIKRTDVETAQPILRIDRQQIQATGLQNVGDILQRITSSGAAINSLTNNGSAGGTYIDLRYLGTGRVLVLLNGKRLVSGNLDLIPSSVIDHIEILQDGASAVYGSDAIAGVVNIITRQNFNGAEASAQYGKHWTQGHRDGETQQYSFSLGTSNDHSSVFINLNYKDQKAVMAGDRDYAKEPYHGTGNRFGSSGTPLGRFLFFVPPTATTDPSGLSDKNMPVNSQLAALCPTTSTYAFGSNPASPTKQGGAGPLYYPICDLVLKHQLKPGQTATIGDFRQFQASDHFNFAPLNYLQTPYDVYSLYMQGHYDFSPNLSFNTSLLYSQEYSQQLLAPTPIFIAPSSMYAAIPPALATEPGGINGPTSTTSPKGNVVSNGLNPFNPFGFGLNASGHPVNGYPNNALLIGRRTLESGYRNFQEERHVWRFTGGFQGGFNTGSILWDWDASWNYNQFDYWSSTNGLIDLPHLFEALQGCPTPFVTGATCVPTNLWGGSGGTTGSQVGTGTITPAQAAFYDFTGQSHSTTRQRIYNADITTSNLAELPAGGLGLALGYEYRELDAESIPGPLDQFGEESGQPFSPIAITKGRYHVNSFYGELNVPLVANVPGFYNLNLDLAERRDDYSTFGNNNSGKAALKWQPIHDLLLRGTWSQGFRAPGIGTLFGPSFSSYPTIEDPCDASNGERTGNIAAICAAQGVPANYSQPNSQIREFLGSNPHVGPESSISRTVGFVYSPSWVPGLNVNADYYKIELTNEIQTIGGNAIVQLCYTTGEFCDKVNNGTGGKPGPRDPSTHGLINIQDVPLNIGGITTEGWDAGISYKFPSTGFGDFTASLDTTHVMRFVELLPSGTQVDLVNADSALPAGFLNTIPAYKTNLEIDWAYGNWGASILGHYVSHYTESCAPSPSYMVAHGLCSFPNAAGGSAATGYGNARNHVGAVTIWDAQVSYDFVAANTSLSFGIDNIFDKQPPRSTTAFANSFNNEYYPISIIGRYPYLQATVRF